MNKGLVNKGFMELRKRAKITQREVSVALDVRQGTVSDWERGKHLPRLTPAETLKLINLLGCTLEELAEAFSEGGDSHVDA